MVRSAFGGRLLSRRLLKAALISGSVSVVGETAVSVTFPIIVPEDEKCLLHELAHAVQMSMMQQPRGLLVVELGGKVRE